MNPEIWIKSLTEITEPLYNRILLVFYAKQETKQETVQLTTKGAKQQE